MKNIYSNILKIDDKNISKAIKNLKKNATIGIPTETVYGLAGNAYSEVAVKKIYQLKKRPLKNPLIIHYIFTKAKLDECDHMYWYYVLGF
jgi:L-threonylcarbamoyladenylate synthase